MTKVVGVVPARMASSRFPGKPLKNIAGRPLVEHCFRRAQLAKCWDGLFLATCDAEIHAFGEAKGFPVIMTAATHTRALDRVAEAAGKCGLALDALDIVVCVQADEPLLGPDMIDAVIAPFRSDPEVTGTMLAVPIVDEEMFLNPDIVKLVHDMKGDVLYTSRSPIPHCKVFSPAIGAKRVGGVFGFRWHFLQWFTRTPESPLEISEACDSNRICDNGFRQRIAPVPYRPYVSVDSPEDVQRVEAVIKQDPLWGKY
ncbi:MAG: 3-deoxy-manno-octulosonate cytidylyltransferase [Rhodospirillales bacterium]|nr:3-deoxy-manno-octulosonate cytidylyltransferase [Rhodospirillales bacterium]